MTREITIEFDDNAIEQVESPFAPQYDYEMSGKSLHPFEPTRQREEEYIYGQPE